MKITCIEIKNFRLLREFSINLEKDISLVIGKNNSGKTSFLTALDKFLNASEKTRISYDDFNVDLKNKLIKILAGTEKIECADVYIPIGIGLKIHIEYDDTDDLTDVRSLIMSLDPNDNYILLGFDYEITHSQLCAMASDYEAIKAKYQSNPALYLSDKQQEYFGPVRKKSISCSNHEIFLDLNKEQVGLQNAISFKYISAKRSVTNKENDKTLSAQTSAIYKRSSQSTEQDLVAEEFKEKLRATDTTLSELYKRMFAGLLGKVAKFGGLTHSETHIKISSTLQHRELLEGNTTVVYTHDDHDLPEHFNGLGYMNLISMIFEIEMQMASFRRSAKERPAAINLLFIEEPEAHTHPQMQYVFIKNIKDMLRESRKREDELDIHLQTIISTHSSHIIAECDFDDIKYLKKAEDEKSVDARSLASLQDEYSSKDPTEDAVYKQQYKFLKQYLTLNRAELFFADKAILIEGATERILLPAMMKKIDQETPDKGFAPLLSQNISIVEVGAHAQIFEKFIRFIGIKTLVVTDIDSGYDEVKLNDDGTEKKHKNGNSVFVSHKCTPDDAKATFTNNSSLTHFHGKNSGDLKYFLDLKPEYKALEKTKDGWSASKEGTFFVAYQTADAGYHARSFEDSFFSLNKDFLGNSHGCFPSLTAKWFTKYVEGECDAFTFSMNAVNSKPSLAIEILLNSLATNESKYSNWKIPQYIEEGLKWLRK